MLLNMKVKILYISGKKNSGKTSVCKNINKIFTQKYGAPSQLCIYNNKNKNDFAHIYYGITKQGKPVVIILNSTSDLDLIIQMFIDNLKQFLISINVPNNDDIILITAIRNEGDVMRKKLEKELGNLFPDKEIVEIPLSRVNQNSSSHVHGWYHTKIEELIFHTLKNQPFNVL